MVDEGTTLTTFRELVEKRRLNVANAVNGVFGGESLVSQLLKVSPPKVKKVVRRTQSPPTSSNPERRSLRLQKIPAVASALPEEEFVEERAPRPIRKKRKVVAEEQPRQLSREEIEKLNNKASSDWLVDMEKYLIEVEGASERNYTCVMRQVKKLVTGQGVSCKHWGEGISFCKGRKITLSTDFNALRDEAIEFEYTHGEDPGHGWRLTHPIQKLRNYQLYYLQKEA